MKEYIIKRHKKIFRTLRANGIKLDAILLKNRTLQNIDINFFYYTGLKSGIFENAVLLLHPDCSQHLITTKVEEPSTKHYMFDVCILKSRDEINKTLTHLLKSTKKIGIHGDLLSCNDLRLLKKCTKSAKFIDVSKYLNNARIIKDTLEVQYLKKSARISMNAWADMKDFMHINVREYEAVAEINYLLQKYGSQGLAFDTIAAFGANSAEPHAVPSRRKLQKGLVGIFDFGAKYNRYCSDITRAFVAGNASKYHKEVYETVYEAQQIAFESLRAGIDGKDVYKKVENFIASTKFKGKFIHSLGHGLGLTVHDYGFLASNQSLKLKENMVFTVEPGIYIKGWGGIRLEDDVLIKKNGIEFFTKPQKELIEI